MTTALKERPILFGGPMVRAILEGRKTQTRRVVKPQPTPEAEGLYLGDIIAHRLECPESGALNGFGFESESDIWRCPYGAPGERLWVRETWLPRNNGAAAFYRASMTPYEAAGFAGMYSDRGWRPSIFMPRALSRITLEIADVRIRRVQEISEGDAQAEGVIKLPASGRAVVAKGDQYFGETWPSARQCFTDLWDSINAKRGYSWESNPWVWVIDFKRTEDTP